MGVVRAICLLPGAHAPNLTGPMRPRPRYIWPDWGFTSRQMLAATLPAVVGERLVGIGHSMCVLALAHGGAAVFGSLHQFSGEAASHGLLAAGRRRFDDPAHRKSLAAIRANLDRHLIRCTADTARVDFRHGLDVVQG